MINRSKDSSEITKLTLECCSKQYSTIFHDAVIHQRLAATMALTSGLSKMTLALTLLHRCAIRSTRMGARFVSSIHFT
jgi:hypothetical protein